MKSEKKSNLIYNEFEPLQCSTSKDYEPVNTSEHNSIVLCLRCGKQNPTDIIKCSSCGYCIICDN